MNPLYKELVNKLILSTHSLINIVIQRPSIPKFSPEAILPKGTAWISTVSFEISLSDRAFLKYNSSKEAILEKIRK